MTESQPIEFLKQRVEKTLGFSLHTPKDFSALADQIFAQLKIMLSPTTLKRLWGYLQNDYEPRLSTLNILSRFVGYESWQQFVASSDQGDQVQSNLILQRHLRSEELQAGEHVQISWLPDRRCVIRYLGDSRFEVVESYNATLAVGDQFSTSLFIEGEPLYVDHLDHDKYRSISYVAGKISGIRFQILDL